VAKKFGLRFLERFPEPPFFYLTPTFHPPPFFVGPWDVFNDAFLVTPPRWLRHPLLLGRSAANRLLRFLVFPPFLRPFFFFGDRLRVLPLTIPPPPFAAGGWGVRQLEGFSCSYCDVCGWRSCFGFRPLAVAPQSDLRSPLSFLPPSFLPFTRTTLFSEPTADKPGWPSAHARGFWFFPRVPRKLL